MSIPRALRLAITLAVVPLLGRAQVTLRVTVPANTLATTPIFVAGSFNQWNPGAAEYRLTAQAAGQYAITLPPSVRGPIEFKFTLGSWDVVEQDSAGRDVPNRAFTVPTAGTASYAATVARWRDGSPRPLVPSSATASVSVLSDSFAMPQLGRTRRVWLYLPPGYATSRQRYPVLYMHDGQNVFDARTSFAGEWGVDETLDSLRALGDAGVIVVAVDNGQQRRFDEYSPWPNPQYGGGQGDGYVDFLVQTLKPYIDQHYRTLPDRLHTGIAGSSMGGLISLYAALKYPDVFGRVGVFSPAFWVAPSIFTVARNATPRPGTRIYIVTGGQEGDTPEVYVHDHQRMIDTLRRAGFVLDRDVRGAIRPDGKHAEWFWRREFPAAYQWLFLDAAPQTAVPAWTHGGVCYEIFVRSFSDSNGDGIGDLNGLIQKLDYVAGLGVNCIWLMPVAASPSYHGYDVSDYYHIEPAYGTNDDFQRLVAEAHRHGIAVLVDMVLNHSSSEHPYFQAALHDTTSPYRAWYRFAPTSPGKDWHHSPVRDEYYYGLFWSGMPDLNYETPAVREEAKKIATFWLRNMGVDGFRLDAVPYLVEQGDCVMGCPGTHTFLHEYAQHIDSVKPGAYTVGEAWGSIAKMLPYYPDQLTSYFGFELSDSLLAAVRSGWAAGLLTGYLGLQDTLRAYRWAPFLSNHDQTRTLTQLKGDVARARLAATLLLTLPGTPFIYYGEEIGMTGDKPDPRLRTPMQWGAGPGLGFTSGKAWESAQPDSLTTTVAAQDADSGSLLNLYRRLIHLRKQNEALATGKLVPLTATSPHVTAYLRRTDRDVVLVVANLGDTPATRIAVSSEAGALPAGRYSVRDLLGSAGSAALAVGADGQVKGYLPVRGSIAPHGSVVLELTRR